MQAHISLVFHFPELLLFWTVYILAMVQEALIFRKTTRSPLSSQDAGTLRIIQIGSQLGFLSSFAASFSPWFPIPWPGVSFIFGTCLLLAGGILRHVCFRALGKHFTASVIVTPDQPIIDQGPYRWVRHPSYTAGFIINLGLGFALGNCLSVVIPFAVACFVYLRRVRAEEKALLETIGEPYRAYMSRTKRFIPFLV